MDALRGARELGRPEIDITKRIADIAIDPMNENVWYVAVGSGGVWKTENAGTTWSPIADNMPFYSTGCITIDPYK